MASPADIIGVYIAAIITTAAITLIATTATITVIVTVATITTIVAYIITITAIGETYRVAVSKSSPQGKGRSTRCGLFPFPTPDRY
jgi:hypothetical protein